uniref:GDP-fucose pyrophosphorylase domain-containing protein n=1 Tax=Hemiselmis andersenii TaxID=464988 RepID=A0A6U5AX03_HEMAN|mmetsp:Transcript_50980/g.123584  ORF Transcript_50980/g.123584 Transcript_50980/m.123584 type:complete len:566 (+) Transcript_50980:341-2038(+)
MFRAILGGKEGPSCFWDVVLITAADETQAFLFEEQLRDRKQRGYLPASSEYRVISDPPGPKIGNGGATLIALNWLRSKYTTSLHSMRVLLIHAGGYSQRTPNHSVCGKIFAPLPVGPLPGSCMLEMCLAMLCDIPPKAIPGVMVKCGDDVIIFDSDLVDFSRPGFSALAHRSPVEVAFTHGVFCLSNDHQHAAMQCRRFTHKPSLERMREYGALLDGKEEEAYTDSSFFFDWSAAAKLLKWFDESNGKIECEIDAYGDFLQALGPEADTSYCSDSSNALSEESASTSARIKVFEVLRGVDLNVCLLEESRFWHIGTLPELLHHFCGLDSFLEEAGGGGGGQKYTLQNGSHGLLYYSNGPPIAATVSSVINDEGGNVAAQAVIEMSVIGRGAKVNEGSFVSSAILPESAVVPPATFLHTLAVIPSTCGVNLKLEVGYVTHILGVHDNVKARGSAADILWAGVTIEKACHRLGIDTSSVWEKGRGSLWDARLFPVASSRQESATLALAFLAAATQTGATESKLAQGQVLVSLEESLAAKHAIAQLAHRRDVQNEVVAARGSQAGGVF